MVIIKIESHPCYPINLWLMWIGIKQNSFFFLSSPFSHKLLGSMDGTQFLWLPWFPEKSGEIVEKWNTLLSGTSLTSPIAKFVKSNSPLLHLFFSSIFSSQVNNLLTDALGNIRSNMQLKVQSPPWQFFQTSEKIIWGKKWWKMFYFCSKILYFCPSGNKRVLLLNCF